jgi:predicted RNA-binding protein associated with RNAse of E/G family
VLAADAPAPWLVAEARWTMREVATAGLRFMPGDTLHEFFSPDHWFNVFSVFAPDGALRGWYANVTHPATVDFAASPAILTWHDLYVDVILLPDRDPETLDEDELAASGLASTDPGLHARILATRDELLRLARARAFPFHERDKINL